MIKSPFKSPLKTLVIIDGFHLNSLAKRHNMNIEFEVLRDLLGQSTLLGSPRFYTTVRMTGREPANNVAALLSWLSFHGYNVTTKNIYQIASAEDTRYTTSNINMLMCIDAISLYAEQGYGRLLIFSGNGEIVPFIQHLREFGVQIDVVSSLELDTVSQEVRSNCDYFYEFTTIAPMFFRSKDKAEN